jgi:hypothetical protein
MDEPERPSTASRERSVVEQREESAAAGRRANRQGSMMQPIMDGGEGAWHPPA